MEVLRSDKPTNKIRMTYSELPDANQNFIPGHDSVIIYSSQFKAQTPYTLSCRYKCPPMGQPDFCIDRPMLLAD